jgi:hypothetical protein
MARPARSALVPALRPDLSLTAEEADLSSAAVDAFTVAIGGRQALLATLAVADGTPEVHKIVNFLIDPRYGGWSLRRICTLGGLTIADLFSAYKKALLVKAHLEATRIVAAQLVAVVDDVMTRAHPYEVTCERCGGTASVTPEPSKAQPNPIPQPCATCRATGRLICLPDLDRQKVALELGQLLQSRAGINVQQNNLSLPASGGFGSGTGTLEQLQQAVHEVLYPRSPALDAPVEGEVLEGVPVPCDESSPPSSPLGSRSLSSASSGA